MTAYDDTMGNDLLRKLPSVDRILNSDHSRSLQENAGKSLFLLCLREELDRLRERILNGETLPVDEQSILENVRERVDQEKNPALCRVINATGIILHTGLGRAVLPPDALAAISTEQKGYSLLEVDRETGDRSMRETEIVRLLKELTGAEAATVVNNNAGATLIALATLAREKEVIVSRGQLVEIGGSFRIPDVMEQSGAKLVEVGTTNKTNIQDYEKAITSETALLLKVHTSNYKIIGFTHTPSLDEMIELGNRHNIKVMDDLGSGALVDLTPYGILDEPLVQQSVESGAEVITFSGDKLLGGPQAGLIVGKKKSIEAIRRHPLYRALRVDKLNLTALEATLKLYLNPEQLRTTHPTLQMISAPVDEMEKRALELASQLQPLADWDVQVGKSTSEIGGGSVPTQGLPTRVVTVKHSSLSPDQVSDRLRKNIPCIFTRVQQDRVLLDVRTLQKGDRKDLVDAFTRITSYA